MAAVNVEGFMGGVNRFLYGAGGGNVAATQAGRQAGRLGARVAGRFNAMRGIARQGGAFGVIEAMGRPVGNAALQGMMIGAAGSTALQVYGNVTSGRNVLSGIPGAAIRGGMMGGVAGGIYGVGRGFMGAPTKLARTTASAGWRAATAAGDKAAIVRYSAQARSMVGSMQSRQRWLYSPDMSLKALPASTRSTPSVNMMRGGGGAAIPMGGMTTHGVMAQQLLSRAAQFAGR